MFRRVYTFEFVLLCLTLHYRVAHAVLDTCREKKKNAGAYMGRRIVIVIVQAFVTTVNAHTALVRMLI